jgi:integrase
MPARSATLGLVAGWGTAVDDERIRKNPCRIKGADQDNSPERPTVTIGEVYAIADAIKPWWRTLVLMAAFSSLRWGELIALRQRYLDLEQGLVTVKAKLAEVEGRLERAYRSRRPGFGSSRSPWQSSPT